MFMGIKHEILVLTIFGTLFVMTFSVNVITHIISKKMLYFKFSIQI